MNQLICGDLLWTPALTEPNVGIAFIVLFVIEGLMVWLGYDGMNAPIMSALKEKNQD